MQKAFLFIMCLCFFLFLNKVNANTENNILGIEYLKALKRTKSKIEPISIERIGSDYNSDNFNGNMASSTDIRNMVKNNSFFFIIKTFFQSCTTECLARKSGKQNIIM